MATDDITPDMLNDQHTQAEIDAVLDRHFAQLDADFAEMREYDELQKRILAAQRALLQPAPEPDTDDTISSVKIDTLPAAEKHHQTTPSIGAEKMWLTEAEYAKKFNVGRQTLCNWRYKDEKAGRAEAAPGHKVYCKFGRAVRYYIEKVPPGVPPADL